MANGSYYAEKEYMEVSAIVVSYNSQDRVERSVGALQESLGHLDHEILVVDNASSDRTVELAGKLLPGDCVIVNRQNLGFGQGVNRGLRAARGRYSLIMNDDVVLEPGSIDRLLGALRADAGIAVAGPLMVDAHGQQTHSARLWYPGWEEEWVRLTDIVLRRQRKAAYPGSCQEGLVEVKWLVAACMLGRTDVLRAIGGFNPAFFMYGEDIDFGRRLRALGYVSVTIPGARAVHEGGASTSTVWSDEDRMLRRARSRDTYYRMWVRRPSRMLLNLRRALGFRNQPLRLRYFLPRVIYDGPSLRKLRFPDPIEPDLRVSEVQEGTLDESSPSSTDGGEPRNP